MDDVIAFIVRSPGRPEAKSKYLLFPDLSASAAYSNSMVFHDSKLPRPESYPSTSTSFSRSTIPAKADHGIVALSICTFEFDHGAPVRYLLFFLREALARLFREEPTLEEDPYIDWAHWGPDMSRWFAAPSFEQWRCSVHGYRFVTLVTRLEASTDISLSVPFSDVLTDDDPDSPLHLLVIDFNPYPLRRHGSTTTNPSNNAVVLAPSDETFHDWEIRFDEKVFGRLACRITLMEEPADYAALAACEDNVIGIQVRGATENQRCF